MFGEDQQVTFDPYAPPRAQHQAPWPSQPSPPRARVRTAWIVAAAVFAALMVPTLIVAGVYVAGRIVRTSFRETRGGDVGFEQTGGPSIRTTLPPGWQSEPITPGRMFRLQMSTAGATIQIGYIGSHERVPLDAALDFALIETGYSGLDRAARPLSRDVGGEPATMLQLTAPGHSEPDVWVVVFYGEGVRWVVTYSGPDRGLPSEPYELGIVLGGWRW